MSKPTNYFAWDILTLRKSNDAVVVAEYSYLDFYNKLTAKSKLKLLEVVTEREDLREMQHQLIQMCREELVDVPFRPLSYLDLVNMLRVYLTEKLGAFDELYEILSVGKTRMVASITFKEINKIESVSPELISTWVNVSGCMGQYDYFSGVNGKKYIYHDLSLIQHLQNNEAVFKKAGVRIYPEDFVAYIACTDITQENNP